MGKRSRKRLGRELEAQTAEERARRTRIGGVLESEAERLRRGEQTPEVEATRTFWASQKEDVRNWLARTGNRAGYGALQLELGREEGRQVADVTRRGRMRGVDIYGQLYGGTAPFLSSIYGQRLQEATAPKFWQRLAVAAAGGAAQAGGAYAGAKYG